MSDTVTMNTFLFLTNYSILHEVFPFLIENLFDIDKCGVRWVMFISREGFSLTHNFEGRLFYD